MPPPFGRIEKDYWHGPHIPNDGEAMDLLIPPRPRARTTKQPDRRSYYPQRNDTPSPWICLGGSAQFFPTGGIGGFVSSCSRGSRARMGHCRAPRQGIYSPGIADCLRCLPNNTSYESLVDHCVSWEHQNNMTPTNRRIPKELWDPRNQPGYSEKSHFKQVKACLLYKQ